MLHSPIRQQRARDYLSLAKTLREIAHSHKRSALRAEADGFLKSYRFFRQASDRAWRNAKYYLNQARIESQ